MNNLSVFGEKNQSKLQKHAKFAIYSSILAKRKKSNTLPVEVPDIF